MIRTFALVRTYLRANANPVPLIKSLIIMNIYPLSAIDPEPVTEVEVETRWSQAGRKRLRSRFLKGPVSLKQLQTAAKLPGRTLHLYLAVRHRCDLCQSKTVTLPSAYLETWGLDKDSKRRALTELELVGLITVGRRRGRTVVVTLL